MPGNRSFLCPNCGSEVPANAKACPECGSDEKTGWSEETSYDEADIPNDEDFDYDELLEKEGLQPRRYSRRVVVLVALTVILLLGFLAWFVF
jgi:uncharacterized membrane protein YvbJ